MPLGAPAADGGQRWLHAETGLVAGSSVEGGVCCLSLLGAGGARCSAALVFLALAEFEMLDATEDSPGAGPQRVFRLPGKGDSGR